MPVDPIELLFERPRSLLREVVVDGRTIVNRRPLLGVRSSGDSIRIARHYRANPEKLATFSAHGRRFRLRFKTGSKRNWIAGKPFARFGNSVLRKKISAASDKRARFSWSATKTDRRAYDAGRWP